MRKGQYGCNYGSSYDYDEDDWRGREIIRGICEESGNDNPGFEVDEEDGFGLDEDELGEDSLDDLLDGSILLNAEGSFYANHTSDEIHNNFRNYVEWEHGDRDDLKKKAREGACKDLEGFIIKIIKSKFRTYTERDRDLFQDLLQCGRKGIIASLKKYDPDITKPTTFFFQPIKHEMVELVNNQKHGTKPHMATAKKKIREVDRAFAAYNRTPDLAAYTTWTGLPWKRVATAVAELQAGSVMISSDNPDMQIMVSRSASSMSHEDEVMSNYNLEKIRDIACKIEPDPVKVNCFIRHYAFGEKIRELAEEYGIDEADITESSSVIISLLKYNEKFLEMYPHYANRKRNVLANQISTVPNEEGDMALENVLKAVEQEGQDLSYDGLPSFVEM